MYLGLENKRVLITGATQGIGAAIANEFLQEGAMVCISGRNEKKLVNFVETLRAEWGAEKVIGFAGDLLKQTCIDNLKKRLEQEWGGLDIIIPNIGSGKPLAQDPLEVGEWERLLNINLLGGVKLLGSFGDMLKRTQGNIIMISSIVAKEVIGTSIAYAASKTAVLTLTKYLAKKLALENVRVN